MKASNVMNDTDGTIKLCDYTASIFTHYLESILSTGEKNTKYNYKEDLKHLWLAPEVNFKLRYDTRCDIWGIGCLALELLTAKPPFYDQTNEGDKEMMVKLMKKKSKLKLKKISSPKFPTPFNTRMQGFPLFLF